MIIDHIKHSWHFCKTKTKQVHIQGYLHVSIVCDMHCWLPSVPTSLEALFTLKFSCLPPMLHYLCTLLVPPVRPWISCGLASKKQKAQVNSLRLTVELVQSILAFKSWLRFQQLLTFLQKLFFDNFLFYLVFLSNLLASPVASFQLSGSNFGRVWRVWDSHDQTAGAAWAGSKKLWKNGKKSEISGTRKN